jgi:hypothetical protein
MTEEQCRQCNTRETCLEIKDFDGTPCPNYREQYSQQAETEEVSDSDFETTDVHSDAGCESTPKITREYLKVNTRIHGWLIFFFVAILVGAVFSLISTLVTFDFDEYGRSVSLALFDILTSSLLLVVAILTVVAFMRRNSDAVFLGKMYIVAVFAINLFTLIMGGYEESGVGSLSQLVRSLVWAVVWFCYLTFSKQVKSVIPKGYRKVWKQDYLLLALLAVVPIVTFAQGYHEVTNRYQNMLDIELAENERTNGYAIFSIPKGFECEEDIIDGDIFFNLFSEDTAIFLRVYGCYDEPAMTKEELLDTVFVLHNDNDFDDFDELYSYKIIHDGKTVINGFPCYYRVKMWDVDDEYFYYCCYRLYILWDDESDLCCVIRCYDWNDDSYLEELLNSVRFH